MAEEYYTDDLTRMHGDGNVVDSSLHSMMCAMVHVPPEQLIEGVLHLARSHRPLIRYMRIFVSMKGERDGDHDDDDDDDASNRVHSSRAGEHCNYIVLFLMSNEKAASDLVQDLHGKCFSSLEPTKCKIYRVLSIGSRNAINLSTTSPYSSLRERSNSPFRVSPSFISAGASVESSSAHMEQQVEVNNCAVCLEKMVDVRNSICTKVRDNEKVDSLLTTVCNHTFHIDCLLRWEDTCPVCRFDHSGSNQTLSSCTKCGSVENIFICLICGIASCSGPDGLQGLEGDDGNGNVNHAFQHYKETLHAYALEAETQHVWDFAGSGYVHRLLRNKEDGKLVEFNNPANVQSKARTLSPGMTDAQEGEFVHRKLESFADQYQVLLKRELDRQMSYFVNIINSIKYEHEVKVNKSNAVTHTQLIGALKQERHQLQQKSFVLQRKIENVSKETEFQKDLSKSIEYNNAELKVQLKEAKRLLVETRVNRLKILPELQGRVDDLMKQLEVMNA